MTDSLALIAGARSALERARTLEEVKSLRDTAVAAKKYAEAKQLGAEAINYAQEIVNRAERRLGEMLKDAELNEGGRPRKNDNDQTDSARESVSLRSMGVSGKISSRAQTLAALPEPEFEAMASKPTSRIVRVARDRQAEAKRVEQARREREAEPDRPRVDIRLGDFREVLADLSDVDAIITDPPYPKEYLHLLGDLASWADKALKPDGVLAVLMGQFWLPDVYRLLGGGRPYRWTACYLTPGGGYVAHDRRTQTNWKPILIYGGGPRFADILRSEGDAGAKSLHHWGQDYAAFHTLVERLTERGQTVVDPFMGSGTTLLAAYAQGRHAIGCDVDEQHVATARGRLA